MRNALFKFCFWLRWPNNVIDMDTALAQHYVAYFFSANRNGRLSDLPADALDELTSNLSARALLSSFAGASYVERGDDYVSEGRVFTERRFLANVAWYFLGADDGFRYTVTQAKYTASIGAFDYGLTPSYVEFQQTLSENYPILPFLYVEDFHSDLDFNINPEGRDFAERVDELLDEPDLVRGYLGACKWATNRLKGRLDKRTLKRIRFPEFPESLAEAPHTVPPLPMRFFLDPIDMDE